MKTLNRNGNIIILFDRDDRIKAQSFWTKEKYKKAIPISNIECNKSVSVEPAEAIDADMKIAPYKYAGKLFSKTEKGNLYGSIQSCGHAKMAITAAHCVMDGSTGTWYENLVFKQQYPDNTALLSIMAIGVKKKWIGKDYQYDYALVVLDEENKDGFLDYKLGVEDKETLSFGYPSNYSSGEKMMCVKTPLKASSTDNTAELIGQPFEQGASGGACIQDDKIIGVISRILYTSDNKKLNIATTPVLNDEFQSLYDYMLECL